MKINHRKAFSLIELSIVILIIGILVAGVTQSSRLVAQFRLSSARSLTKSSPVASISDLALWLDSTSEQSFDIADQEDGFPVDNWYDINPQSISKINFTQATAARQPLYKTNSLNGLPSIKFDGLDVNGDYLQNSSVTLNDLTQSNQVTIFLVQKVNNSNDNSAFFVNAGGAAGDIRINFHGPESGNLSFDFGTRSSGSGRVSLATPAGYVNNPKITALIRKTTNANIIRINGVESLNSSAATSTFTTAQLAATVVFDLQCISQYVTYCNDSNFGEFIMFRRALKADEITDVERYLSKKWGIKI